MYANGNSPEHSCFSTFGRSLPLLGDMIQSMANLVQIWHNLTWFPDLLSLVGLPTTARFIAIWLGIGEDMFSLFSSIHTRCIILTSNRGSCSRHHPWWIIFLFHRSDPSHRHLTQSIVYGVFMALWTCSICTSTVWGEIIPS